MVARPAEGGRHHTRSASPAVYFSASFTTALATSVCTALGSVESLVAASPSYTGHLEVRKIEHNGMMRWKNGRIFTSKTLRGEHIGLEEIDDGVWSLYYGPVLLARFDEREMKFYG